MTWSNTFYIGSSVDPSDFKTLDEWIFNNNGMSASPDATFSPFSGFAEQADSQRKGRGFPRAVWHWSARNDIDIEVLRSFITDLSGTVYIRTPTNEVDAYGVRIWETFQAVMLWPPDDEDKQAYHTLGFTLEFRKLIVTAEPYP